VKEQPLKHQKNDKNKIRDSIPHSAGHREVQKGGKKWEFLLALG
jgi:hypothetical protein